MSARWLAGACIAWAAAAAAAEPSPVKASVHHSLRPGVYGRIEMRSAPPLIYPQPVTVRRPAVGARAPVYLYVPPGQVRRWAQNCARWDACDRPVYFVRVDDSPSRLGGWKKAQRPQPADSPMLHALNRFTQ